MSYRIPLFKLNYGEEEIKAVEDTIRSKWISCGPKCEELENLFATMMGGGYAVGLSNCTDALHLGLLLCGIGPDDEVLCPSLTFAASVNCIRYVGATPVFCDIVGTEHLNIDPADIERKITEKTKGIVVVHMAGFPAKMEEIIHIAKKYGLKVIEDACHGPLSEFQGKKLGTIGDVGCFSFFSNKNISTGEGGLLFTKHADYAERAKRLRSHGMTTMSYQRSTGHATEYDINELGFNFRIDDIRSSLAIVQLKKLGEDLKKREKVRNWYLEQLEEISNIVVPFSNHKGFVSNYIMQVVIKDSCREKRDSIRNQLHQSGIQTSIHYPAVHRFSIYQKYAAVLPKTEYVVDNEITLPMFGALTENDVNYIVSKLRSFL